MSHHVLVCWQAGFSTVPAVFLDCIWFYSPGSNVLPSANETLSLVGRSSAELQKGFCRFELIYSFGRMIGLTVLPIFVPLFLMSVIYACTIVLYRRKVGSNCEKKILVKSVHKYLLTRTALTRLPFTRPKGYSVLRCGSVESGVVCLGMRLLF